MTHVAPPKVRDRDTIFSEALLSALPDGVMTYAADGRCQSANKAATDLLGVPRETLLDQNFRELEPWRAAGLLERADETIRTGLSQQWETNYTSTAGKALGLHFRMDRVDLAGEPTLLVIFADISERKEAAEALSLERERLFLLNRAAVEMSHCLTTSEVTRVGIRLALEATSCDGGVLRLLTPGARGRVIASKGLARSERARLTGVLRGLSTLEEVPGSALNISLEKTNSHTNPASRSEFTFALVLPVTSRGKNLALLCLGCGQDHPGPSPASTARGEGVAALIGVALENAGLYDQARYLAQRDPVTGLLNHRGINAELEKELARCMRQGGGFALLMMDIDNFKLFNDTYGHACGDKVLQHISAVLSRSVRRGDTVGRYGGDEFVALLPNTDAEGAARTIERIQETLGEVDYFAEGDSAVPVFMSYGVATYPFDGRHVSEILAFADTNLYRSKHRGDQGSGRSGSEGGPVSGKVGLSSMLDGLVTAVDGKDHYTRKHSDDVCQLAVAVAAELGLSPECQRSLRIAALLHDVGKIGIPDRVLRKPGRLSEDELEIVKQHVDLGELITKGIPDIVGVMDAVSSHHERYDGRGYPHRLKGQEIPLLGRILAATDAYSAMTMDRPYRKALSIAEACGELARVSGSQLDPRVVKALLALVEQNCFSASSTEESSASVA
jgi:diguanylate cyclase (GGDEF)-like protein/PAS domain S-box-containing protein